MTANPPSYSIAAAQFADWLPPMLVKELRQGLRTHMFVGAFVTLQVAMVSLLGFQLLAARDGGGTNLDDDLEQYLWIAIIFMLAVVMPLRGLMAISEETKGGTIDLVQLTHLSSVKIVLHKWLALISQTMLLVIAMMPYMVLRYFFGGDDVWFNVLALGWLTLISISLTAVCIAVSSAGTVGRLLVIGVIGFPGFIMASEFVENRDSLTSGGPPVLSLAYLLLAAIIVALTLASKQLSAPGENGTTRFRVIAIFLMAGAGIASLLDPASDSLAWIMWMIPLMIVAGLESLSEPIKEHPGIYAPFVRRGMLGRTAGRVLYPGWTSGVWFVLMLGLMFSEADYFWYARHLQLDNAAQSAIAAIQFTMALVFPAAIMPLMPSFKHRHWLYVGIQAVCFLITIGLMTAFNGRESITSAVVSGLLPMPAMVWEMSHSYDHTWHEHINTVVCSDLVILALILFHGRHERRQIRTLEAQAKGLLTAPSSTDASLAAPLTPAPES